MYLSFIHGLEGYAWSLGNNALWSHLYIAGTLDLYSFDRPYTKPCTLTLIPYYSFGNQGLSGMRVWIPEAE